MADASASTQTLQVRFNYGRDWGNWTHFTVKTEAGNALPVATVNGGDDVTVRVNPHRDSSDPDLRESLSGTMKRVDQLLSHSDSDDGDWAKIQLKDTTGGHSFYNTATNTYYD